MENIPEQEVWGACRVVHQGGEIPPLDRSVALRLVRLPFVPGRTVAPPLQIIAEEWGRYRRFLIGLHLRSPFVNALSLVLRARRAVLHWWRLACGHQTGAIGTRAGHGHRPNALACVSGWATLDHLGSARHNWRARRLGTLVHRSGFQKRQQVSVQLILVCCGETVR